MKKVAMMAASMALVAGLATIVPSAYAARKKVDCGQVMQELNSGKKPKEVAKDLKISVSSVGRCRRKAKKAGKAAPGAADKGGAAPVAPAASKP